MSYRPRDLLGAKVSVSEPQSTQEIVCLFLVVGTSAIHCLESWKQA